MLTVPMFLFCLQVELTAERGLAVNADQQVSDLTSKPFKNFIANIHKERKTRCKSSHERLQIMTFEPRDVRHGLHRGHAPDEEL